MTNHLGHPLGPPSDANLAFTNDARATLTESSSAGRVLRQRRADMRQMKKEVRKNIAEQHELITSSIAKAIEELQARERELLEALKDEGDSAIEQIDEELDHIESNEESLATLSMSIRALSEESGTISKKHWETLTELRESMQHQTNTFISHPPISLQLSRYDPSAFEQPISELRSSFAALRSNSSPSAPSSSSSLSTKPVEHMPLVNDSPFINKIQLRFGDVLDGFILNDGLLVGGNGGNVFPIYTWKNTFITDVKVQYAKGLVSGIHFTSDDGVVQGHLGTIPAHYPRTTHHYIAPPGYGMVDVHSTSEGRGSNLITKFAPLWAPLNPACNKSEPITSEPIISPAPSAPPSDRRLGIQFQRPQQASTIFSSASQEPYSSGIQDAVASSVKSSSSPASSALDSLQCIENSYAVPLAEPSSSQPFSSNLNSQVASSSSPQLKPAIQDHIQTYAGTAIGWSKEHRWEIWNTGAHLEKAEVPSFLAEFTSSPVACFAQHPTHPSSLFVVWIGGETAIIDLQSRRKLHSFTLLPFEDSIQGIHAMVVTDPENPSNAVFVVLEPYTRTLKAYTKYGELVVKHGFSALITSFTSSQGHVIVATSDGYIWRQELFGKLVSQSWQAHEKAITSLIVVPGKASRDNNPMYYIISTSYDNRVAAWNLLAGDVVWLNSSSEHAAVLLCTPEAQSRSIVARELSVFAAMAMDGSISVFDTWTGNVLHSLPPVVQRPSCMVMDNDYLLFSGGSQDCRIHVWAWRTNSQQIHSLSAHTQGVFWMRLYHITDESGVKSTRCLSHNSGALLEWDIDSKTLLCAANAGAKPLYTIWTSLM